LLKIKEKKRGALRNLECVIVPVDFSEESLAAVDVALDFLDKTTAGRLFTTLVVLIGCAEASSSNTGPWKEPAVVQIIVQIVYIRLNTLE